MRREAEALVDHVGAMSHQKNSMSTIKGRTHKGLVSYRCRARKNKGKGRRCGQYTRQTFPFCPLHTKHHGSGLYKNGQNQLMTSVAVEQNHLIGVIDSVRKTGGQQQAHNHWAESVMTSSLHDPATGVDIDLTFPNASTIGRYTTNVDTNEECNAMLVQHRITVHEHVGTTIQRRERPVVALYATKNIAPHTQITVCEEF
jgi:hypothetical protein